MSCFAWAELALPERHLFLFLHTTQPPPAAIWDESLEALKVADERTKGDISKLGAFAITDGGSPDSRCRGLLGKCLKGRNLRSAVLTDLALVRGVVTAMSWFNKEVRAFSPAEPLDALAHLSLDERHLAAVLKAFTEMQSRMDSVRTLHTLLRTQSVKVT